MKPSSWGVRWWWWEKGEGWVVRVLVRTLEQVLEAFLQSTVQAFVPDQIRISSQDLQVRHPRGSTTKHHPVWCAHRCLQRNGVCIKINSLLQIPFKGFTKQCTSLFLPTATIFMCWQWSSKGSIIACLNDPNSHKS